MRCKSSPRAFLPINQPPGPRGDGSDTLTARLLVMGSEPPTGGRRPALLEAYAQRLAHWLRAARDHPAGVLQCTNLVVCLIRIPHNP